MSDSYNELVGLRRQLGALAKQQQGGRTATTPAAAAAAAASDQGSRSPASQPKPAATDGAAANAEHAAEQASGEPGVREGEANTRAQLEEQYTQHLSVLHSAVGLVAMVAAHNPGLVMAGGLRVVPLLEMLQGAINTLKVSAGVLDGWQGAVRGACWRCCRAPLPL
eukprot:1138490-Pelagomonas_calceolata.AAC.2